VAGVSASERRARLLRAVDGDRGLRCFWCDDELAPSAATLDHVVPQALGGGHAACNTVWACEPCNSARGCVPPVEWLVECESYGWRPNRRVLERELTSFVDVYAGMPGFAAAVATARRQLLLLRCLTPAEAAAAIPA
jgi:HNH endonuclease